MAEGSGSAADVAANLREALVPTLDKLCDEVASSLLDQRYKKFRGMGVSTICSR